VTRQADLFTKTASEIVAEAVERFRPVAVFACFSGGNDSVAMAHWMVENVPGTRLVFINTGVGVQQSIEHARDTCKNMGWDLTEIRAKEDCGQDYDYWVRRFGFPGPHGHKLIYNRLKGRAIELLVRRTKNHRMSKVLLATGLREDESLRRMGYRGQEINRIGAQVWINPIYWWSRQQRDAYIATHSLPRNPVSETLGISGECACGAFAHPGEHEKLRQVDPDLAARFDRLHEETKDRFPWPWEGRPPKAPRPMRDVGPLCIGCEKSAIVQAELLDLAAADLV
jgi:3'-phosphoadenosine 5'-phosphosulfate sulfotransferase (PAPS reductase)/FAD synthetase